MNGSVRRWRWFFAVLAVLRLVSCVPFIVDDDEAWWVVAARALRTPFEYYRRAVDHKPPGIVWFYWFADRVLFLGRSGIDPRVMRGVFTAVLIAAGYVLGRLAADFERCRGADGPEAERTGWIAASFFLIASALASPKLLTVTSDGLLVVFVILGFAVALRGRFRWSAVAAGALLGCALLIKQTAVFFAIPVLLASWPRRFTVREISGMALGAAAVYVPAAVAMSFHDFLYWNLTYPREVLVRARNAAFDSNGEMFGNLMQVGVVLAPLLLGVLRSQWRAQGKRIPAFRDFRAWWLLAAAFGTFLGKGLFLHYYLLMMPPLCLLAADGWARAQVSSSPRCEKWRLAGIGWLAIGYGIACLIVALPFSGLFWGNDLPYYQQVGRKIRQIARPGEPVLVWGGTALPLAYAKASFAGRFLIPRFAEPPYDTEFTQSTFHRELLTAPPRIIVDLHERGDNQFNNPIGSDPFVLAIVRASYRPFVSPGIPWAKFYLSFQPPAEAHLEAVRDAADLRRLYEAYPREQSGWNRFVELYRAKASLSSSFVWQAFALDRRLRASASLELIAQQSQDPAVREEASRLNEVLVSTSAKEGSEQAVERASAFLARAASGVAEDVALPWQSMDWWPESAIVELQPKYFVREDKPSFTDPDALPISSN